MPLDIEMVANSFRGAATKQLTASPFYAGLALQIADDGDILEIARMVKSGQSSPLLLFSAVHSIGAIHPGF
ncbi:MAG: hypothetical protein DRH06_02260 [Deltaproteobacteria bacterium]|nr:MAG: hypothetical protein DRH07_09965 [Deltaproteobacteria bacterium]RLB78170.1 MAG: hypothetical protein DRH06_02260 [Deltaproteobacteria bacterium]